jgi:hypothetical protein
MGYDGLTDRAGGELLIVILSYGKPQLSIGCIESICKAEHPLVDIAVCEQKDLTTASCIQHWIDRRGISSSVVVRFNGRNQGFSAGNNFIVKEALTYGDRYQYFVLMNSDTYVRDGAIDAMVEAARAHQEIGIVAPRLEWPSGEVQTSGFRFLNPLSEFIASAGTGAVTRLLSQFDVTMPNGEGINPPEWASFAAVLIKRQVFETTGLLDEGYFLYFEDVDYCRRARKHGWRIVYVPEARIVHLRGQSGPVKEASAKKLRRPRYYYESRARYYIKFYGIWGLWMANLLWMLGRCISLTRELIDKRIRHTCASESRDIWIGAFDLGRGKDR